MRFLGQQVKGQGHHASQGSGKKCGEVLFLVARVSLFVCLFLHDYGKAVIDDVMKLTDEIGNSTRILATDFWTKLDQSSHQWDKKMM